MHINNFIFFSFFFTTLELAAYLSENVLSPSSVMNRKFFNKGLVGEAKYNLLSLKELVDMFQFHKKNTQDKINILIQIGQYANRTTNNKEMYKAVLFLKDVYKKENSPFMKMVVSLALKWAGESDILIKKWDYNATSLVIKEIKRIADDVNKKFNHIEILEIHCQDNSLTKGMWMFGSDIDGLTLKYRGKLNDIIIDYFKKELINFGVEIKNDLSWQTDKNFKAPDTPYSNSKIIYNAITNKIIKIPKASLKGHLYSLKNQIRFELFTSLKNKIHSSKEMEVLYLAHIVMALYNNYKIPAIIPLYPSEVKVLKKLIKIYGVNAAHRDYGENNHIFGWYNYTDLKITVVEPKYYKKLSYENNLVDISS